MHLPLLGLHVCACGSPCVWISCVHFWSVCVHVWISHMHLWSVCAGVDFGSPCGSFAYSCGLCVWVWISRVHLWEDLILFSLHTCSLPTGLLYCSLGRSFSMYQAFSTNPACGTESGLKRAEESARHSPHHFALVPSSHLHHIPKRYSLSQTFILTVCCCCNKLPNCPFSRNY